MSGPADLVRGASAPAVPLGPRLAAATSRLRAAGVASPRADAEQLAAFVLGVPRGRLALLDVFPFAAARRFDDLVGDRARRVPLQHLTGVAGFRHLDLAVGPGVFVPRPETESVVEWALAALAPPARPPRPLMAPDTAGSHSVAVHGRVAAHGSGGAPVCIDLCAGSGAIALSLAAERPGAVVHAVEADAAALGWLRRNVAATGLAVTVHDADLTAPLPVSLTRLTGTVDLVISNPPYLPDADQATVEPEVGQHDPARALWGGADGLDLVRVVVDVAARLLRPGGLLVVEHADGHGTSAPALLAADGRWGDIADHPDLAGRDRFVTARAAVAPGR